MSKIRELISVLKHAVLESREIKNPDVILLIREAEEELAEWTRIANKASRSGGCQECEYDQLAEMVREGAKKRIEAYV